jgi:hypothetical protein
MFLHEGTKNTKASNGNKVPFEGFIMALSDTPLSLEIAPSRGFMYQ